MLQVIILVLLLISSAYFVCFQRSSFEDRHMAYTLGSAFYAIYFIISFPMFLRIDKSSTAFQSAIEACATAMVVFCLLDFVRLGVADADLVISRLRPCKLDASLTCMGTGELC
jgi:cycloeucalenol cycloisomerase